MSSNFWQVDDKIEDRYLILKILGGPGKSGMGVVYICFDSYLDEPVAVKTYQDKFFKNKSIINRFMWEAEAWVNLEKHPNIVQAKYVKTIKNRPYIFLEVIVGDKFYGSDLKNWIYRGGFTIKGEPNIPLILNFCIQFCDGMIHAQKKFEEMGRSFVHRDIKPENIMITHNRVVKTTDFGLVKSLINEFPKEDELNRHSFSILSGRIVGTPPYMSPEQCKGEEIDVRSDIYSFGCVLHEMLTNNYIFDATTPEVFIYHHIHTDPKKVNLHPILDKIISKCLKKDPEDRYQDFKEVREDLSQLYHSLTGKEVRVPDAENLKAVDLNYKGLSFLYLGLYEEAVACFQDALKIDSKLAEVHGNLGNAYEAQGYIDMAIKEYKEAVRINPNDARLHLNLGAGYSEIEEFSMAIEEYKEAIKLDSNLAEAHANLGSTYAQLEDFDMAIEEYKEAIRINPEYEGREKLGSIYHRLGDLDMAIEEYKEAIRINPNQITVRILLGSAYKELGDLDMAIKEYKEAIRINPNDAETHNYLGLAYAKQGDLDKAIEEYKKAIRINPEYAKAHNNLGVAFDEKGNPDMAIEEYKEAIRINPEYAKAHVDMGITYCTQGKLDMGINEFLEALRISPDFDEAHFNLGITYHVQGNIDLAIKEYEEAIRINPKYTDVHFNLGAIYMDKEKYQEAKTHFQEFLRLAPPHHTTQIKEAEKSIRWIEKNA